MLNLYFVCTIICMAANIMVFNDGSERAGENDQRVLSEALQQWLQKGASQENHHQHS